MPFVYTAGAFERKEGDADTHMKRECVDSETQERSHVTKQVIPQYVCSQGL